VGCGVWGVGMHDISGFSQAVLGLLGRCRGTEVKRPSFGADVKIAQAHTMTIYTEAEINRKMITTGSKIGLPAF
jgi:hypothetical protein